VLAVIRRRGGLPFSAGAAQMLRAFAGQAGVAVELGDARRLAERHGLVDDRERIARDLHDVVVQRIFASAMTLTATERLISEPEAVERVRRTVDDLDATIRQIRSTIFALQSTGNGHAVGLRERVLEVLDSASAQLGFSPALQMEGLLDTVVPDELAHDLVAVLQESLSNIVRHARATRVEVRVSAAGGRLTLLAVDDGVGIDERAPRSGLANLEGRAVRREGSFSVEPVADGGSLLRWSVPLPSS
jgi:signal transduction histidine kinase